MPNLNLSTEVIVTTTDNDTGEIIELADETASYNPVTLLQGDIILGAGAYALPAINGVSYRSIWVQSNPKNDKHIVIQVTYTLGSLLAQPCLIAMYPGDIYMVCKGGDPSGLTNNGDISAISFIAGNAGASMRYIVGGIPTING